MQVKIWKMYGDSYGQLVADAQQQIINNMDEIIKRFPIKLGI